MRQMTRCNASDVIDDHEQDPSFEALAASLETFYLFILAG